MYTMQSTTVDIPTGLSQNLPRGSYMYRINKRENCEGKRSGYLWELAFDALVELSCVFGVRRGAGYPIH